VGRQRYNPKGGGRPGNQNAVKTGAHSVENRALRKRIAALVRQTNVAVAEIERKLPRRKPGPKPGSRREKT